MRKYLYLLTIIFSLFTYSIQASPKSELRVSRLFSDHMVLQQKQRADFWGKDTPGQKIAISASWGKKVATKADEKGNWNIKLATPKAGGPYEIRIETTDSTILIKDVLIGEVWLASGQSNMDIPVKGWLPNDTILNSKQEIAQAHFPNIRMLKVPFGISSIPLDTLSGGEWYLASPETVGDFSATAYFYAKKLYQELNVPVGIIVSSIGGTPAEAWTSKENLTKLGDFNQTIEGLESLEKSTREWFKKWPTQKKPFTDAEWQNICFNDKAAADPCFNDSKWSTSNLPGRFDLLPSGEFDGAIWFRKTFEVQDITTDYVLKIDAIDDFDETFINGKKVGGLSGQGAANAPRIMTIPGTLLHVGINTIAIRAIDTGGPGTISGEMTISNNQGVSISLEGEWKSQLIAEIYNGKFYTYNLQTPISERPNISQMNSNSPTVLYNAMIHPLVPYTIKGVIWYQGESNVGRDEQYKRLFPAMIEDWRDKWGYKFPFYYVQIAPYFYSYDQEGKSQKLRNAQRLALKTPKTGMAVTLDIGRLDSAHPAYKQEVAARLARFSLSNEYGRHLVVSGPLYKKTIVSGSKLIIEFESIGDGLVATENGLTNFQIAGKNKSYFPAEAQIVNNKVVLSSPSVKDPVYARYAWSDGSVATLFNKIITLSKEERLPASTFTTDE